MSYLQRSGRSRHSLLATAGVVTASALLLAVEAEPAAPAPAAGHWQADLPAVRATFPAGPPIDTLEDLFRVHVRFGPHHVVADTHLFDAPVTVIPYHDSDRIEDASGAPIERGDEVIAQYFPPGEIGIAVKHHRASHRTMSLPHRSLFSLREDLKLQDSHIELVIGVVRDGKPGAVTLSSPQSYEGGRFGTSTYPMIFLRPVLPQYLSAAERLAFRDNIRTMMVGFAAVAELPCNYSGGDPVAADDPDRVREHAAMLVRTIAGDAAARSWFRRPESLLYCAELAHVAMSAGVITPLNAATFVPLVGEATWTAFLREVQSHNAGRPSRFAQLNDNRLVPLIRLALAPDDLRPAAQYAPRRRRAEETRRLAFQPMTMSDVVELFVRTHVPRQRYGEGMAILQAELLRALRPGLEELFGIAGRDEDDPLRRRATELYDRILLTLAKPYGTYGELRRALASLLDEGRRLGAELHDSESGYLVPPSLFHGQALGLWGGGLLDLEYVGHGLHFSLVRRAPESG